MYLDFFKFKKNPFHITPDPDFLFLSPSHEDALTAISYGIEQRKGIVLVTGEVGVGKTTILRSYLEGTDPEKIRTAYIFNAVLSFHRLLEQVISELGIPAVDGDIPGLIDSIRRYAIDEYKSGHNVVLIIDEAQNMPAETLDRLLMLSNMETSRDKLLQVVLVGQPELENRLNLPELRRLSSCIAIRKRIVALRSDESLAYIQHRLIKASSFYNPVFTQSALKRIVKWADGIPRIINILCDNALVTAFGYQQKPVNGKIINEVIKDLRGEQLRAGFRWRYVLVPVLVAFVGVLALASMLKEIPPAGQEVLTGKVQAVRPAAEVGKGAEVKLPVENKPKAEPKPSVPEAPVTGGGKGVSGIEPPASPQLEILGRTRAPVAEKAPPASVQVEIPKKAKAPVAEKAPVPKNKEPSAQKGIAKGPKSRSGQKGVAAKKLQSYRYSVQYGSYVDEGTAEEVKNHLAKKGYDAVVKTRKHPMYGDVFVVQIRPVDSVSGANKMVNQLNGEIEDEPEVVKVPSR